MLSDFNTTEEEEEEEDEDEDEEEEEGKEEEEEEEEGKEQPLDFRILSRLPNIATSERFEFVSFEIVLIPKIFHVIEDGKGRTRSGDNIDDCDVFSKNKLYKKLILASISIGSAKRIVG